MVYENYEIGFQNYKNGIKWLLLWYYILKIRVPKLKNWTAGQ